MSAADFATIREALEGNLAEFSTGRPHAIAALARIERNTLTPKQAGAILGGLWAIAPDGWLEIREVLDRIAGDAEEATVE